MKIYEFVSDMFMIIVIGMIYILAVSKDRLIRRTEMIYCGM